MKHLTIEEMIDFVSMTSLDEKSLQNASVVAGHIAVCDECLEKVDAFQMIYDEFSALERRAVQGRELYELIESRTEERAQELSLDK